MLAISLPAYFKVSSDRISIAYEKQKKDSYSYKIQLKDKNITSKISGNRKYEKLLLDSMKIRKLTNTKVIRFPFAMSDCYKTP